MLPGDRTGPISCHKKHNLKSEKKADGELTQQLDGSFDAVASSIRWLYQFGVQSDFLLL